MNLPTLDEFFADSARGVHHNNELEQMLKDIVAACIQISVAIDKGALNDAMGSLDSENVQGEVQKALDVICNDIFIEATQQNSLVAGMVSEEMPDPYLIPQAYANKKQGMKYLLLFDPLDGSSNVNVNISVGTIFSILRCPDGVDKPKLEDFLQPGTQQVCAGYALYGSSTMLVFTIGEGVNGFTLDRDRQTFLLTYPNLQVPADTDEFAINMSNQRFWEPPVQRYISECLQGKTGVRGKDFNMRWVASMAAEVHRILMRGGVFMYPNDSKSLAQQGKLRLMYEANPMSFIIEQAGGMAICNSERLLALQPTGIHQRVSVMMGSKNEVSLIAAYHRV